MKYLSLFSGVGGFERGIQQAYENNRKLLQGQTAKNLRKGLSDTSSGQDRPTCIGYSEIDKYATQIYQKHFNHKNYGDITKINETELPDFDFLCGGFPCQSFSIAGKRRGFEDTRGTLFFDIARILKAKKPRLLLLENVKGLLSHDGGKTFRTIIATLAELGYDLQWQVLNSKNFGVPQNRERVFIIGYSRGTTRPEVFPIIGESEEDTRTMGQEISYTIDANYHKGTNTLEKSRRQVIRQPFIQNPKMMNYKKDYENSVAITATSYKEPPVVSGIRRLTPTECERLQGFPDGWTENGIRVHEECYRPSILKAGGFNRCYGLGCHWNDEPIKISDTQRYKTLGNAVTVNVIQAIMERLLNHPTL